MATIIDISFAEVTFAELSALDADALDRLPFGLIGLDPAGVARIYNAAEAALAGLDPSVVIGAHFFESIAQCMNNFMVAQRFEDEPDLDAIVPFVLTLRMAADAGPAAAAGRCRRGPALHPDRTVNAGAIAVAEARNEEERLLQFLYAAPVGLVEIDDTGTIRMINPYAMKHLLPLAGQRDTGSLFSILEKSAPELRNLYEGFARDRGTVCEGHRIAVDLGSGHSGAAPKMLSCTLVKLAPDRAIATITDITLQVAQERRLKQAEVWFATLLNDANDYAVLSITCEGIVDAANESIERQTGFAPDTIIGRSLAEIGTAPSASGELALAEQLRLAGRDGWFLAESWQNRKDGSRYWCQRMLATRTDADGALDGYTVVLRDVAPQALDTALLRRMLTQDHLTGAANRAYFMQALDREQHDRAGHRQPLSLVMLDVDHFKAVNDTYGHPGGDLVLRQIVEQLGPLLRGSHLLARLGGEEFAILLPSTSLDEAVALAERLRGAIEAMRTETPEGPIAITASLGCATMNGDETATDALIRAADAALYVAKRNGRNRVAVGPLLAAAAA